MLDSGLPGRPNDQRAAAAPEPHRLARLDPHAPEDLLDAARLERGLDVVVRADRHAAGDEQHVARQAGLDGRARRLAVVRRDAVVGQPRAGPRGQQATPARWTRGSAPARAARPSGSSSLPVTIRCSARAAVHRHLADPGGGERRQRAAGRAARRRPPAGRPRARPRRAAHVAPGRERVLRDHLVAGDRGQLGLEDRVGPAGNRGAGGDRRGGPGGQRRLGRPRRRRPRRPAAARCPGGVGRAHRVAVHRRAVERRQVDRAQGVLGGDPAGGRGERHALGRERRDRSRTSPSASCDRAEVSRRSATSCAPAARSPGR